MVSKLLKEYSSNYQSKKEIEITQLLSKEDIGAIIEFIKSLKE